MSFKSKSWCLLLFVIAFCWIAHSQTSTGDRVPILVELFTSEGCSSCPPADRYLEYLDTQPLAGAQLIILSEHVDYWNQYGWKDRFSSAEFSRRQTEYASKLNVPEVYTPQLVIDGVREMPGGDVAAVESALINSIPREKVSQEKIPLTVSVTAASQNGLRALVNSEQGTGGRVLELFVALVQDRAETQVTRGENARRRLTHAAVVRKLVRVRKFGKSDRIIREVEFNVPDDLTGGIRIVAFLQDPTSGRVYGAAMAVIPNTRNSMTPGKNTLVP